MTITQLELQNFKNVLGRRVWKFSLGSNNIIGPNGAGKTTILEGIRFGLFGKKDFDVKSILPLRKKSGKLEATLILVSDAGEEYTIKRELSIGSKKHDLNSTMTKTGSSNKITKEDAIRAELDAKFHLTSRQFVNSCYARQGQFMEMQGESAKSFFERALDLDRVQAFSEYLEEIGSRFKREARNNTEIYVELVKEVESADREGTEASLKQTREETKECRTKLPEIKRRLKKMVEQKETLEKLRKQVEALETERDLKQGERTRLNEETADLAAQKHANPLIEKGSVRSLLPTIISSLKELESEQSELEEKDRAIQGKLGEKKTIKSSITEIQKSIKEQAGALTLEKDEFWSLVGKLPSEERPIFSSTDEIKVIDLEDYRESVGDFLATRRAGVEDAVKKNAARVEGLTQIESLEQEAKDLGGELRTLQEDIINLAKAGKTSTKKLEELVARDLNTEVDTMDKEQNALVSELSALKEKHNMKRGRLLRLEESLKRDTCPECGSDLSQGENRQALLQNIKVLEEEVDELESLLPEKEAHLASCKEKLLSLKLSRDQSTQFEKLQLSKDRVAKSLDERLSKVKGLRSKLSAIIDVKPLRVTVQLLENVDRGIETLKGSIDAFAQSSTQLVQHRTDMESITAELKALRPEAVTSRLKAIKEEQKERENAKKILEDIATTQKKIMDLDMRLKEIEVMLRGLRKEYDEGRLAELESQISSLESEKSCLKVTIEKNQQLETQDEDKLRTIATQELKVVKHKKDQIKFTHLQRIADLSRNANEQFLEVKNRQLRIAVEKTAFNILQRFNWKNPFSDIKIDQDFNITLYRDGQEIILPVLSGGEKVAVALAIRIAIVRELRGGDLLILDEPTTHVDNRNIPILRDLLTSQLGIQQLFIVDQHDDLKDIPGNFITV